LYGAPSNLRAKNKDIDLYDRTIGDGLFSLIPYTSGQIITVFIGYYISSEALEDSYFPPGYMIQLTRNVILDCYSTKRWLCMASLANSCKGCIDMKTKLKAKANSNIHVDKKFRVTLKTLHNIGKFEEIICNYGMGYIFPEDNDVDVNDESSDDNISYA